MVEEKIEVGSVEEDIETGGQPRKGPSPVLSDSPTPPKRMLSRRPTNSSQWITIRRGASPTVSCGTALGPSNEYSPSKISGRYASSD